MKPVFLIGGCSFMGVGQVGFPQACVEAGPVFFRVSSNLNQATSQAKQKRAFDVG